MTTTTNTKPHKPDLCCMAETSMMGVTTLWGVPMGVSVSINTFDEFFIKVIDVTLLWEYKEIIQVIKTAIR